MNVLCKETCKIVRFYSIGAKSTSPVDIKLLLVILYSIYPAASQIS